MGWRVPIDRTLTRRERLRRRIWHTLKDAGVLTFPLDVFGRTPNFQGAGQAAELLARQPEFTDAQFVFCSPDHVLRRMREIVLERGKILVVSFPLRSVRREQIPLLQIRERKAIKAAADVDNFSRYGRPFQGSLDLVILGSVVVDRRGHRLSPHRGFGDREWNLLVGVGAIHEGTKVATLVHPLQFSDDLVRWVIDEDVKVDLIVTPHEVVRPEG